MKKKGVEKRKVIGVIILLAVIITGLYVYFKPVLEVEEPLFAPLDAVTRSFEREDPYTNEAITVTLLVDVQEVEGVGITIEESVPVGVTITEISHEGEYNSNENKIRWAIEPISDIEVTYKISISNTGDYDEFGEGLYIFIDEAGDLGSARPIGESATIGVTFCEESGEICNGIDDDCDHDTDEEDGTPLCSGNTPTCSEVIDDGCICTSTLLKDITGNCNLLCDVSESPNFINDRTGDCDGDCDVSESPNFVNDRTGNCDAVCDAGESSLALDQNNLDSCVGSGCASIVANCDGNCEETPHLLDNPATGGNCNGCVDTGEIGHYKVSYLAGGQGISAEDYTVKRRYWLEGITACTS